MKIYKFIIFSIFIFLNLFNLSTYAKEIPDTKELVENNEFVEKAPEIYESFSPKNLINSIISAFKNAFSPTTSILSGFIALILISAIANAFSENLSGFDLTNYTSTLCFSAYCFSIINNLCENLTQYSLKLRDISLVLSPTLISASVSDGIISMKTTYSGLTLALVSSEFLLTNIAIPFVKLLFVFSLVSSVCRKTLDLSAIFSSLKTFVIFFVSLVMTAIVTALHFQTVIAKAADSVGLRAIRFTATSFIPIVGALVGESFKTVTEALCAVKGIIGAFGVASVISACLPPIAAILIFKLEITLCTCLAKTLGCKNEASYLHEVGGILNVLNAAILACSIGFAAIICILTHSV